MTTPLQYITTLDEPRRSEIKTLYAHIKKTIPKLKPFVIESAHGTIIGFGKCKYESKSGCKGEWFTVGLAERKAGLTIYICAVKNGKYLAEYYKDAFAKAKIGRSCITVKRIDDIDMAKLTKMLKEAETLGMCFG